MPGPLRRYHGLYIYNPRSIEDLEPVRCYLRGRQTSLAERRHRPNSFRRGRYHRTILVLGLNCGHTQQKNIAKDTKKIKNPETTSLLDRIIEPSFSLLFFDTGPQYFFTTSTPLTLC
jgi:hypothetical protein